MGEANLVNTPLFMKRLYPAKEFFRLLSDLILNIDGLISAGRAKRIGKDFVERIMMAVTEVNGCRYCSYFHTRVALKAGIKKEEINEMLSGEFHSAPENEKAALFFAQHYAEMGGQPHPESTACMIDEYGEAKTMDIIAYIRAIMVGNALGNMFDALLSRLQRNSVPDSKIFDEFGVVFGVLFMVPILLIFKLFGFQRLKQLN